MFRTHERTERLVYILFLCHSPLASVVFIPSSPPSPRETRMQRALRRGSPRCGNRCGKHLEPASRRLSSVGSRCRAMQRRVPEAIISVRVRAGVLLPPSLARAIHDGMLAILILSL